MTRHGTTTAWTSGHLWRPADGVEYMLQKSLVRHGARSEVEYTLYLRHTEDSGCVARAKKLYVDGGKGSAKRLRIRAMAHYNGLPS